MPFEVTPTIEKYVNSSGKTILNACPGSGKTSAISYKLSQLIPDWDRRFNRFCGIACLSFTNVAKDEIHKKYVEFTRISLDYPHLVSTIDSFINSQITLPHYHLLEFASKRPKIIDDESFLNEAWQGRWNFKKNDGQLLCYSYAPGGIEIGIDGKYNWNGKEPDSSKVSPEAFNAYCKALKSWQIREVGILKTTDSAYMALHLLKNHPRIAEYLANRFPVIIVDEAQDTSDIQLAILDILANSGLNSLELVGDPYQCLYEWRNAKPSLLIDKIQSCSDWNIIDFTDNRRSTMPIVRCFSKLRCQGDPYLIAVSKFDNEHPVYIFKHKEQCEHEAIEKYFDYCKTYDTNRVLVRGKTLKRKLLGGISDEEDFWKSPIPTQLVYALNELQNHRVKDAIRLVRSLLPQITNPTSDYAQQRDLENELKQDYEANALLLYLLRQLPKFELPVKDWSTQAQEIFYSILFDKFMIHQQIDFELKKGGKFPKLSNEPMEKFYGTIHRTTNLPVSTIHQVKGMTLDSALLFLSGNNSGLGIGDLYQPSSFPTEKQRLMYVAMSRPRYLLAIGLPDTVSNDDIRLRFGSDVLIE